MSRSLASTLRLASGSRLSRPLAPLARSILTSAAPSSQPSGAIGGVDPRVLKGVDEFISATDVARVNDWQAGLWERLQAEVRNNPRLAPMKIKWDNDKLDITDLLSFTAREPALALAFNYASLLINNSYFLEGINAEAPKAVPEHFKALEDRVAGYAEGITGGGWLWIVKSGDALTDFDVVPTFGAGTLLVTMRQQRGRQSLLPVFGTPANTGAEGAAAAEGAPESTSSSPASSAGRAPRTAGEVTPVAVLNIYQHAYLDKYGVFGAGQYARDWFRTLDWDKVQNRAASVSF